MVIINIVTAILTPITLLQQYDNHNNENNNIRHANTNNNSHNSNNNDESTNTNNNNTQSQVIERALLCSQRMHVALLYVIPGFPPALLNNDSQNGNARRITAVASRILLQEPVDT